MICSTTLRQLPHFGIHRIALTCGVFDGLHLGHRKLIDLLQKKAEETRATAVLVTFDPHPKKILRGNHSPKRLLSQEHQLHLLEHIGLGAVVILPFTPSFARLQPEEFLREVVLVDGVEITAVVVGQNWRFGYRALGNTALLKTIGAKNGFSVQLADEKYMGNSFVSSTRIRAAITQGNLAEGKRLLGRSFSIFGTVVAGKGIATTEFNCPTANIAYGNEILPPCGVYAAKIKLLFKGFTREYYGILYLGTSPTLCPSDSEPPTVEVHLFNFQEDIYGTSLEVEFLQYLRADQKFHSITALKQQISKDIAQAETIFSPSEV